MKVLVIEDDFFMRSVYESEFRQENVDVVLAIDGREGLLKAKEAKPDLIITGLILTKLNGFELIKEIRQDKENLLLAKVPILVVSVLSQKQDIDEALALGATKYLSKDLFSAKQTVKEALNLMASSL